MGTEVSVLLWHDDTASGEEIVALVLAEAERIDRLMSTYKDDSRISEINRLAASEAIVAGDELFRLIRRSIRSASADTPEHNCCQDRQENQD